jgi:hypothetical protein
MNILKPTISAYTMLKACEFLQTKKRPEGHFLVWGIRQI